MKVIHGHDRNAVYIYRVREWGRWSAVQYLGSARIPTTVIMAQHTKVDAVRAIHRIREAGMIAKTQVWVKYGDRFEAVSEAELVASNDQGSYS